MAKITDPDNLEVYVHETTSAGATTEEVIILTGPKTLELTLLGGLNDTAPGKTSGVTAKAVYSFLKEEWLNGTDSATLRRFKFPLKMIFEGSFIWVNGWAPANAQTRDLFRDAGFQEGITQDEYSCLISLGSIDAPSTDLVYYTQLAGYTEAQAVYDKTGELNENVRTLEFGVLDSRTYLKSFLREQGKLYAEYNLLVEQGLSVISFQAYSFPLSNGTDLKVTTADGVISTTAPWNAMTIAYYAGIEFKTWAVEAQAAETVVQDQNGRWWFTDLGGTSVGNDTALPGTDTGVAWVAYEGEELIGSTYYAFNRAVDCATGTDIEAYEFLQWSLRQVAVDINDGTITDTDQDTIGLMYGDVAALLGSYVGDTLKPAGGVVLRNFDTNSTNNIVHSPITVDQGGIDTITLVALVTSEVPFPFVAAGNFNFSSNLDLALDAETFYTVYFEYVTRVTSTALLVSGSAGQSAVLDYTGDVGRLDHLVSGDYINVTGFTTQITNNGLWILDGNPTTNTIAVTKQDGVAPIDQIADSGVQVDENPFESPGAVIVDDNAGPSPMTGQITAASIGWDFDYTNNVQGGRSGGTDAPIRVVAQALDGAEWIDATHTITAATGQNIAINAGDERNYDNPV